MERDSYETLDGISQQKYDRLLGWIDSSRITPDIISENTTTFTRIFQETDDRAIGFQVASNYLEAVAEDDPNINDFLAYTLEGEVIASSASAYVGQNLSQAPYFADSLATDDFRVEPPYYDAEGTLFIVVTDIIEGQDDEPLGVMAAYLDTSTLSSIMLDRTGLGETGETYLVSKLNNYFLTPSRFEGYASNQAYFSQGIDSALAGNTGFGIYPDYRGISF